MYDVTLSKLTNYCHFQANVSMASQLWLHVDNFWFGLHGNAQVALIFDYDTYEKVQRHRKSMNVCLIYNLIVYIT